MISAIYVAWKLGKLMWKFLLKKIEDYNWRRTKRLQDAERIRKIREQKRLKKRKGSHSDVNNSDQHEEDDDSFEIEDFDYSFAGVPEAKKEAPNKESVLKAVQTLKNMKHQNRVPGQFKDETAAAKQEDVVIGSAKNVEQDDMNVSRSFVVRRSTKRVTTKIHGKENKEKKEKKGQMNLNLLKEIEIKKKLKLLALMYTNLKNFGFWINAVAFIISYTFVAFTYFNLSDSATETEKGIVIFLPKAKRN